MYNSRNESLHFCTQPRELQDIGNVLIKKLNHCPIIQNSRHYYTAEIRDITLTVFNQLAYY